MQADHDGRVMQSLAGIAAKFKLLGERTEGMPELQSPNRVRSVAQCSRTGNEAWTPRPACRRVS